MTHPGPKGIGVPAAFRTEQVGADHRTCQATTDRCGPGIDMGVDLPGDRSSKHFAGSGQSHDFSASFQGSTPPRWVQTGDTHRRTPSTVLHADMCQDVAAQAGKPGLWWKR